MIKLVAFDLGQVLIHFDIMRAINKIAAFSEMAIPTIKKKIFGKPLGIDLEFGTITPEVFFDRLCEILEFKNGHTFTYDQFVPIFNDIFWINDDSVKLMHRLSDTREIGIISNTNLLHYDYLLETYAIWDCIQYPILSFKEGLRKPDRRIYDLMINKSGKKADEILMIDDKLENVRGAQYAGFDAILFTNAPALSEELSKRNLL